MMVVAAGVKVHLALGHSRRVADDSGPACAAPLDSIDTARMTTMHSIVPRDCKDANVLATFKDEALARQPEPPLRATAVQILSWREEWSVF